MTRLGRLIGLLAALAGLPCALAQDLPAPGETVRLVIVHPQLRTHDTVTGIFEGLGRDSLFTTEKAYARPLVHRLEAARGERRHTVLGAAIGSGVGALVGGGLGAAADHNNLPDRDETTLWWQYSLAGIGVGGLAGALVGSRFRTTRWEVIPLADGNRIGVRAVLKK